MLSYSSGDAAVLDPRGGAIAHIVNDRGGWGRGFVLALSREHPKAEAAYRRWAGGATGSAFEIGMIQPVRVGPAIWVVNMLAQRGYRSAANPCPLDLVGLDQCLAKLARWAQGNAVARVQMPPIGTGLAGGRWDEIAPLIERRLCAASIGVEIKAPDFHMIRRLDVGLPAPGGDSVAPL